MMPRVDSAALERLCARCVEQLPIDAAALSVMTTKGHRGIVCATSELATRLEDVQFTVGEGPGVEAFMRQAPVLVEDIRDSGVHDLSPGFAESAAHAGIGSVFAFPLQIGAIALGTLTLYGMAPARLSEPDLAAALTIADQAAGVLLDLLAGGVYAGAGDGPDGRVGADFYRAEVYQASGMVMIQLGVSIEEAMVRLRAVAFADGRPIGEVARDVVSGSLRFPAGDA
jgi:GAF domain/ANTAR domain